jgi:alkaline phosphatase
LTLGKRWRIFSTGTQNGRATGAISTRCDFGHLARRFLCQNGRPQDSQNIAAQLVDAGNIDVILSGGGELPSRAQGGDARWRDLLLEMQRRNYDLVRTKSELESIPPRAPRLPGSFRGQPLAFANEIQPRDRSQPWRKWSSSDYPISITQRPPGDRQQPRG